MAMLAPDTSQTYARGSADASRPFELRAKLRRITENERERRCAVCAVRDAGPGIEARGTPGAWSSRWVGVLTCGHIWTCPVCSERIKKERLAKLLTAVGNGGGVWQMVSLTVRHRDGMPLRGLVQGLMRAWRRARQGGATQRVWTKNVTASARALEITRGANGWHPHLHVLLHTKGFSDDEKATLLDRWLLCVRRELGDACVPDALHAIRWSTPIDICRASDVDRARYVVKLGLELAGDKDGRRGSSSVWDLAELAVSGDAQARGWWLEYARATKGRRAIELDDRAAAYARQPKALAHELADHDLAEKDEDRGKEELVVIPVDSLELRAIREYEARFDPTILAVMNRDVERSESPAPVVRAWLDLVTRVLGYHGRHGHSEEAPAAGRARGDPQGTQSARDGPSARAN